MFFWCHVLNVYVLIIKESIESANTTIEDEDVKGRLYSYFLPAVGWF